jgi:NTP pyrophosphatase (non-canonical NTP hydrolase)
MARVGGYWRPLAAVARLLEELGELAESLASPDPASRAENGDELASELADLWIITTALADQFLGEVAEPGLQEAGERGEQATATSTIGAAGDPFRALVAAAGQIARIVNYYDGPKTPRSLEGWPSLNDAVAELHRGLAGVAGAHGIALHAAVTNKLHAITVRDSNRFASAEHDPSTAPSLEQFRLIETTPWGTQVRQARLWSAPSWSVQSLASNVAAIVPTLTMFTRAALRERLDGYVITGPALESAELLDDWAGRVLSRLAAHDPRLEQQVGNSGDDRDTDGTLMFNGVRLSATILSGSEPHILLRPSGVEPEVQPQPASA